MSSSRTAQDENTYINILKQFGIPNEQPNTSHPKVVVLVKNEIERGWAMNFGIPIQGESPSPASPVLNPHPEGVPMHAPRFFSQQIVPELSLQPSSASKLSPQK